MKNKKFYQNSKIYSFVFESHLNFIIKFNLKIHFQNNIKNIFSKQKLKKS